MKRLIATLLLCTLLLAGCSAPMADPTEAQEELPTVAPNEYLACTALTYYTNLDEYNDFMEKDGDKLPDDFFRWEDAAIFGEVDTLVLLGSNQYLYAITDSANQALYIYVIRYPESKAGKLVSTNDVAVDASFRKFSHSRDETVFLQRSTLTYGVLSDGSLYSVSFYVDGVEILITGELSKYPANRTDTVLGKLLSPDEAVANAAFAEITEKLSK